MSVVIGFGFPEEVILLSDSRISFSGVKLAPKDELRKIYQLGPMLTVGFTSEHVDFTLELLRRITLYATTKSKHKQTLYLLERIPKVAKYHYKALSQEIGWKPAMEFIYAGMVEDRSLAVREKDIIGLLSPGNSGRVPTKIAKALMTMKDGVLLLEPPSPILTKQSFPIGNLAPFSSLDFIVSGSGSRISDKLTEEKGNLFYTEAEFPMRVMILRMICDEFVKEANIPTVGGTIQALKIDQKGISPITYLRNEFDSQGNEKLVESLSFQSGEWVLKNKKDNTETRIRQNPLIIKVREKIEVSEVSSNY